MITKELLSEVLGVKKIDEIYTEDSSLYFCELNKPINIHELAHKCKEWAFSKHNYDISSSIDGKMMCQPLWFNKNENGTKKEIFYTMSDKQTEPEAIFKACQWILDNENL